MKGADGPFGTNPSRQMRSKIEGAEFGPTGAEDRALAQRNTTKLAFHQTQGMLHRAIAFQASMAKRICGGV